MPKKEKITMRLIQFTAGTSWRGHEQKIIYLYEAFKDYGLVEDQWIICPHDSEISKVAESKGMQVITFDLKSEYDLKFSKKLKAICNEKNANMLFIHSSKAHTLAVISSLLFGLKVPLVLCRTLTKRVDTNFFRKWKYNYKGIKKILCITQPVVDVLKFAVKDTSKLRIVGILTDIKKFTKTKKTGILHKEFNIPDDYKIIGNIADFSDFKDHFTWVNTVKELVSRNNIKAKYILVGKGALEAQVRAQVKALNLEEHIIFTGFRTDIPEILPEFDLFLFTSKDEPAGGVILESYACRIPVVAANAGGIPELVIDKETALLAKVENPIDFADKVELLLQDEELQEKFKTNGYEFLKNNFTKEVIANKMFEELNEVLIAENNREVS